MKTVFNLVNIGSNAIPRFRGPGFHFAILAMALTAQLLWAAAPNTIRFDSTQTLQPPATFSPSATHPFPLDTTPTLQESVKLSSQGEFTNKNPRVTDSLDYVVKLEWQDTQIPVIVLAPDTVSFPGFKILGQATVHQKVVNGTEIKNHTEFIYKLRAETEGTGKASSMKVRYLTGLSKQEEILFVPTSLIDIGKAPVHITDTLWFKILLSLLALAAAAGLGWACYKFMIRTRKKSEPEKLNLEPEIKTLQSRLKSAAINSTEVSKEILLTMEKISLQYLQHSIQPNASKTAAQATSGAQPSQSFNVQLDQYLAHTPSISNEEKQDWEKMKDLFRHARFAGGHKEPHELQDAFKTLKRCLKLTGENEHE